MAKPISTSVPDSKVEEIFQYFLTHKDNRSVVIAENFGLNIKTIDTIIARKLSKKCKPKRMRTAKEKFPNQSGVFFSNISNKWVIRIPNTTSSKFSKPFTSFAQFDSKETADARFSELIN